jgi:hypothetical protein
MALPIDPSFLAKGAEWQIQSPTATPGQQQGGQSFGGALTQAIQGLADSQTQSAQAAASLAAGCSWPRRFEPRPSRPRRTSSTHRSR